jgi:hypothetical protein
MSLPVNEVELNTTANRPKRLFSIGTFRIVCLTQNVINTYAVEIG